MAATRCAGMLPSEADKERIRRHRAFWSRSPVGRPLIGTTIGTFPSVRAICGNGALTPADLDLERNLSELEEEWYQWRDAMGDAIWSAFPLWAFPWHLAIAGSPIERRDSNLWGLPVPDLHAGSAHPSLSSGNPWFRLLVDFTLALRQRAAGRYPLGIGPLMFSPPDIVMQLLGQDRLALELYDAPEWVTALGQAVVELCAEVTEALFDLIPTYGGGYCGTSRYLWAPGKLVETGEDVSFMLSPRLHRRLVVPMHRYLARRFPFTVVHLHSRQLHTVPNLLEVQEIAAFQITPDFGEDMLQHLPVMARILEHKPLVVHGVMSITTMKEIIRSLDHRGLALLCRCESPDDARAVLDALL